MTNSESFHEQAFNVQLKSMIPRPFLERMIVIVALFAGLTGGALSAATEIQERSSKDDAEIRAVMSAQAAAWNRGDIDGFMNGYARSDATEFISGDKLTRGWQTVRDRYKRKYDSREKMGTLAFSELKVTRLSGDAALVIGRWRLVRKSDKPHGRFTLLFRRTSDGWRIAHDHTS
jgi:ketosteroid isomerase-like protein